MASPKTASARNSPSTTRATAARRLRTTTPTRSRSPLTAAPSRRCPSRPGDPGVDDGVHEVDGEVDDQEERREQQHRPLEDRVVAGLDRLQRQAPEAVPGEDL